MVTLEKSCCSSTLRLQLEEIDWSFTSRGKSHEIEAIHPYPAKFISEIPRSFLSVLPVPAGTAVFDPFCGSGTTLTEAQRFGFPSIGIDLNPIACLLSRVKTSPFPSGLDIAAIRVVQDARMIREPEARDIPNVDHWFKPEIQDAIAALIAAIQQYPAPEPADALRLALFSILVRVSNQESDTRYAAIEKEIGKDEVFNLFLAACGRISRAIKHRDWKLPSARVIEADTLKVGTGQIEMPVGIVITSPPYPNAYEYWLYHKYRMWWLGFDPLAVKAQEIGARAHFFKRQHHTEDHFWEQMRETFRLIDAVLVNSGFACFVIGRSKIHGRIVDNADIIESVARECGMILVARLNRVIAPNRKSFNLSHASIKTETIVVLEKS